jgi:hypothetical protein
MLNEMSVSVLLSAAGMIIGVGDFRQERGKGNFGLYQIVAKDDPNFVRIMKSGGLKQQDEALANPVCSDSETEELLSWFDGERAKRSKRPANDDTEAEGDVAD